MQDSIIDKNVLKTTIKNCIHCKLCTRTCDFLKKYDMDLADFAKRDDLKFSCFLCGKCNEVCPKDLDGRKIAIYMRKNSTNKNRKVEFLKNNYKLKNIPKKSTKDLIFLGCNYPGFLPKTCEKLIEIGNLHGAEFSVDCCKKPVYEMGGREKISEIERTINRLGVERLICLCPNCYHFLKDRLNIEVINVFRYLREIGEGKKINETAEVFFPCSDRYNREIFSDIEFFSSENIFPFDSINCCGLGGGALKVEKDVVEIWKDKMKNLSNKNVYTYCSSCAGIFKNSYQLKNVKNFLSEILEVDEVPSSKYVKNVLKFKFKTRR